ncbi:MAG: hypothetical protein ACI3XA_09895 [Clostridia bacterium]
MSGLELFLKENKIKRENVFFPATKSLCDEKGEALMWELRSITTDEDEAIRKDCIREIKGRGTRFDYGAYMRKIAVASVVFPPLYNASLQDSYCVTSPEDLLVALIDKPGEYQEFIKKVQSINGFDIAMSERIEKAKN